MKLISCLWYVDKIDWVIVYLEQVEDVDFDQLVFVVVLLLYYFYCIYWLMMGENVVEIVQCVCLGWFVFELQDESVIIIVVVGVLGFFISQFFVWVFWFVIGGMVSELWVGQIGLFD